MIEVSFEKSFIKAAKKVIKQNPPLELKIKQKVNQFIHDPHDPLLKTHKLSGKLKGLNSFTVDFDCRIIFYYYESKAVFIDIGSHDDVY